MGQKGIPGVGLLAVQFPRDTEAEDVLTTILRPGERVLWLAAPDLALWPRLLWPAWGVMSTIAGWILLAVFSFVALVGFALNKEGGSTGGDVVAKLFAFAVLLGTVAFLAYPALDHELNRRKIRYAVTSFRAFVIWPPRFVHAIWVKDVTRVESWKGFAGWRASGLNLIDSKGRSIMAFRSIAEPSELARAVEVALTTARTDQERPADSNESSPET